MAEPRRTTVTRDDVYHLRVHPHARYADADIIVRVQRRMEPVSKTTLVSIKEDLCFTRPEDFRVAGKLINDLFRKIAADLED